MAGRTRRQASPRSEAGRPSSDPRSSAVPSTYSSDRLTPLAGGIRDGAHPRGPPLPHCPGSAAAHSVARVRPRSGARYSKRSAAARVPCSAVLGNGREGRYTGRRPSAADRWRLRARVLATRRKQRIRVRPIQTLICTVRVASTHPSRGNTLKGLARSAMR